MSTDRSRIVGLDIGTSKVVALVGDVDDVGPRGADHLRHARQHARLVVDLDAQLGDLAVRVHQLDLRAKL